MSKPECCVCYIPYDDKEFKPQILTGCGHTFCRKCVTRIKVVEGFGAVSYKCPICKQKSSNHIPNYQVSNICNEYNGMSKIPDDPVQKSLNDTLNVIIKGIDYKTKKYTALTQELSKLTKDTRSVTT